MFFIVICTLCLNIPTLLPFFFFFFFNDTATTEIYTLFPTRRSSDLPLPTREGELIGKNSAQFGLQSATRLYEAGIASNGVSDRRREYVPGPCTHRPSHHESELY